MNHQAVAVWLWLLLMVSCARPPISVDAPTDLVTIVDIATPTPDMPPEQPDVSAWPVCMLTPGWEWTRAFMPCAGRTLGGLACMTSCIELQEGTARLIPECRYYIGTTGETKLCVWDCRECDGP